MKKYRFLLTSIPLKWTIFLLFYLMHRHAKIARLVWNGSASLEWCLVQHSDHRKESSTYDSIVPWPMWIWHMSKLSQLQFLLLLSQIAPWLPYSFIAAQKECHRGLHRIQSSWCCEILKHSSPHHYISMCFSLKLCVKVLGTIALAPIIAIMRSF